MNFDFKDFGLDLVAVGTLISLLGVCYNNIFLMHTAAMYVWMFSNAIFIIYFFGRGKNWWDGGVSNWFLCVNYLVMFVSGVYGLWFA